MNGQHEQARRRSHGLSGLRTLATIPLLAALAAGCGTNGPEEATEPVVTGWLGGTVEVRAEVDSTRDYSGIDVLVVMPLDGGGVDTLGSATTAPDGSFETLLEAPDRGIYPLLIRRGGRTLAQSDLVIAEGDSTTLRAMLPARSARDVRLRSPENAAYAAYRNSRAQHALTARTAMQGGDGAGLADAQQQAANVMWSLRENYSGTLGAELASIEAVALLAGVDSDEAVARAREVMPGGAAYVPTSRIARKAIQSGEGVDRAAEFLAGRRDASTDPDEAAAIQAEIVQVYVDSLRRDEAVAAARRLQEDYADTRFAEWGVRAEYEAENLLPGLPAPDFTVVSTTGPIALEDFAGKHLLLEFYEPGPGYASALPSLASLEREGDGRLAIVSVSVGSEDQDRLFAESRVLPGRRVSAGSRDADLPVAYNVHVLPTRYLIGPDGSIVAKFVGAALPEAQRAVMARLQDEPAL